MNADSGEAWGPPRHSATYHGWPIEAEEPTVTKTQSPDATQDSRRRRRSGDWFELAVASIGFAALGAIAVQMYHQATAPRMGYFTANALAEVAPLGARYGPAHYSRNWEEWCIRDFFKDRRDGVFVDVGANHYRNENNTYFLETRLGWSGVAIDALEEFGADYAAHRPRTKFAALFVSDEGGGKIPFFVPQDNTLVASASREFTVKEGSPGTARQVPTATLNAVLEQAGVRKVDFLSMDIELSEPKALAGFDIDRFKPELVCIEAHEEVRQQILDYFTQHGYVVIGRYLRADTQNLYFTPLGRAPAYKQ
jgi:FkbM family methyltransferase